MSGQVALVSAGRRLRRILCRRELVPFLPLAGFGAYLAGGPGALLAFTAGFPALFVLLGAARSEPSYGLRDTLTGLPLRAALTESFDRIFADPKLQRRATIAFAVEIDDFSEIEARHGPQASEIVLRRVGERIAITLRGTDVVARIETATFGAAFGPVGRADLEAGIQTAARIQAAVREPIQVGRTQVHATCSVGFCLGSRSPRPTGEGLLDAALMALSEARRAGSASIRAHAPNRPRSKPVHIPSENEAVDGLLAGQIRPWFQPQISTDTGKVSGFEALARWEHPLRGVLGPSEFLPGLNAAGQQERLGEVILYHGLTALRSWDRAGWHVPTLGVNFSEEELRSPRLVDRLTWELDRFGLGPERLAVEILETVVADASDDVVTRSIAKLGRQGCKIDLDDFGTGHASLAALRRFAVTRIKIDRSFVINVDEDREQQKMVAGILSLAEQLGLETLAEGVERVGEHAMLAQLGCGHVQGFGVARPMPFEDTIAWMEKHTEKLNDAPGLTRRAI